VKVGDLLEEAATATAAINESASSVWERMRKLGTSHVVVLREGRVIGVLSRHDMSGPSGGAHRRMGRTAGDLMRRDVVSVSPRTSIRRAASLMRHNDITCLPVLRGDKLVGLLTVGRLLQVLEQAAP
jgi:CBS domain-containing protein